MIEELRKLAKHSGIYGLGIIASKAVGFLMIPVYTRFLLPSDYGVLELLDLVVFFATMFVAMGIYGAVFRFYAAYESVEDKKEVIATAMLYAACGSLICALILIFWASSISMATFGNPQYAPLVRVVGVTFFFTNLSEVPLAYWRAQGRTVLFVGFGIARTVLSAGLILLSLVLMKWGLQGVVYANCLTSVLAGSALFGVVLSQVPRKIAVKKLEEMLRYGIPLVFSGLASFILVYSDRFFLRRYGTLTEVGLYGLGYRFAMIIALIVSGPFNQTWQWHQFEIEDHSNARNIYSRVQFYQLLASLLVGLAIAVLAKDFLMVFTPADYWKAARVVPLIALCYILDNVRSVILSGILIKRKTRKLIPIAFIIAALNLGLNYVLIPRYLAMGAAVATLISYIVYLALTFIVSQRVYLIRYEYARNGMALGAAIVVYLTSAYLNLGLWPSVLSNLLLLTLFVAVSICLLDRDERRMAWNTTMDVFHRLRGLSGGRAEV